LNDEQVRVLVKLSNSADVNGDGLTACALAAAPAGKALVSRESNLQKRPIFSAPAGAVRYMRVFGRRRRWACPVQD